MRVLLGAALILFPQTPQDSLEKKVAALLERMRAEDIEAREAAAKALIGLGDPARPLLEKAAKDSTDAEFGARVKAVAERIRRSVMRGDLPDRLKKRSKLLSDAYGGKTVEDAVLAALAWLARHQEADGSWSAVAGRRFAADPCAGAGSESHDDGVTALAVLAFLGAGYDPSFKDQLVDPFDQKKWSPGAVVRKGLDRLALRQRKDGGVIGEEKPLYGHAIATLAFCEAAAMCGEPTLEDSARRALAYLLEARNPGAAWRYTSRCGSNDTSVTGWCVAALDGAGKAGLWVPNADVKDSVMKWMEQVASGPDSARAGYNGTGSGKVFIPGRNADFNHHETMTAISLLARRTLAPETESPATVSTGMKLIARDPPDTGFNIDSYYWFWGSHALHRIDGAAGGGWLKWANETRTSLLSLQAQKGCSQGSWDPNADRWGFESGRIGVTALNTLSLLTPAR